jgi:hypothetical protein
MEIAPQLRYGRICFKECLGCKSAQSTYHFWSYGPYLALKKGDASGNFVWLRVAVSRRTALYDVADENLFPGQVDRVKNLGQQLTCLTNKGEALHIFFIARSFTDKDQPGPGISRPKDNMSAPFVEFTPMAVPKVFLNHFKRLDLGPVVP